MGENHTASRRTHIGGIVLKAFVLVLIGAGAGIAYNALSEEGIPLRTPKRVSVADLVSWNLHVEGMRITLEEAKRAYDDGNAIFIDARAPRAYVAGHIDGAINIPMPVHEPTIRQVLGDVEKDRLIIAYCSGGSCQNSYALARRLTDELGYTQAKAFYEGWTAWFWAKYPVKKGESP